MRTYRKQKATFCGKKIRYRDRKDAKVAKQRRLMSDAVEYLRIYKCSKCQGYHLTSQQPDPGRLSRRRQRESGSQEAASPE